METRQAIAERWLATMLRTYPGESARFFEESRDPFRNPVGHTYRESAGILVDELLGSMDVARVTAALGRIIEIRAVQDLAPGVALTFLFELKAIFSEERPEPRLDVYLRRIDDMALIGFETYVRCRERMCEARVNEARRSVYVLERVLTSRDHSRGQARWQERGEA
jgi:hypothetical protein